MKIYKDTHMKISSPFIVSKNILEKEFTRGITLFLLLVKNILNVLRHAKNSSIQNIPSGWFHYENTPIQIYRKFHLQKLKIFR